VCYGLRKLLPLPPLVQLIMGGFVFVITGLLYIRSPTLSTSDRDILKSVLPGKATRIMQRVGFLTG
jgi:hypothetical protein